jgi:hypothetical protein
MRKIALMAAVLLAATPAFARTHCDTFYFDDNSGSTETTCNNPDQPDAPKSDCITRMVNGRVVETNCY